MSNKKPYDHQPAPNSHTTLAQIFDRRFNDMPVRIWQNDSIIFHSGVDIIDQLYRMLDGKAAIGPDGYGVQQHHTTGVDHRHGGSLTETMASYHRYYSKQLHPFAGPGYESRVIRSTFNPLREDIWRQRAVLFILRGGDGLLSRQQAESLMGRNAFSNAIKLLPRFESTYMPGSQKPEQDQYKPGGIVLSSSLKHPAIIDSPPTVTSTNGTVTWRFHMEDNSWSAWWSGAVIMGRTYNFGFSQAEADMIDRLSGGDAMMSVDIGISGTHAEVTTIGCRVSDAIVHKTLREADTLLGYLAMGWNFEKGVLMTSDIAGYRNPLEIHAQLLNTDQNYAECYNSFKRITVQPTLTYRDGWKVTQDGQDWTARNFPFQTSLRIHLLNWLDEIQYIDIDLSGSTQGELVKQLSQPYLPFLALFKENGVTASLLAGHNGCFEKLKMLAGLYDLCCWSKGLLKVPSGMSVSEHTRINHPKHENVPRDVTHDRPQHVRDIELRQMELLAARNKGALSSLQWAHVCGLRREAGNFAGVLRGAIEGVCQLIRTSKVFDPSNSVTLLICEGIIAIVQGKDSVAPEASILLVVWQYYNLKQLRPDQPSTEVKSNIKDPLTIAQILYLDILLYALVQPTARHLDRLYEVANVLSPMITIDNFASSLAVDDHVRNLRFEDAVLYMVDSLAEGKTSTTLYKKLAFCLLILDGKQALINARHFNELAKTTRGDTQKEHLGQARRQIDRALGCFPRTASWLQYENALFMSANFDQAWGRRAQGILVQANATPVGDWVAWLYKDMTGTAIQIGGATVRDEVYRDGWAA